MSPDEAAQREERLREALKMIAGADFPGAVDLALSGSWQTVVSRLQHIALAALTPEVKP